MSSSSAPSGRASSAAWSWRSITPKLGAYFGATDGVLVVQAPDNAAFKLEDGDVIQAIDGRKPEDGAHALRILRSYKSGEKLQLTVLRQRKPLTLAMIMPERPEFDDDFVMPPMPPVPPVPPIPPVPPRTPGGAGHLSALTESRGHGGKLAAVRRTDFTYELPEELIAQQPLAERSASRLLTLDGATRRARRPAHSRPAANSSRPATCWCSTTRA